MAAFTEGYRNAAPAVYTWISLHLFPGLRSELDPEDVLQEVACRAFARHASFDATRGEFRAWIFGIARKVLYQSLQQLAGSGGRPKRDWLTTGGLVRVPDEATSVSGRIARDEDLRNLRDLIDELPDEDRQLVLYRGLEGLEHADVGELMGLNPSTAAKRWERLLGRLRDAAGARSVLLG